MDHPESSHEENQQRDEVAIIIGGKRYDTALQLFGWELLGEAYCQLSAIIFFLMIKFVLAFVREYELDLGLGEEKPTHNKYGQPLPQNHIYRKRERTMLETMLFPHNDFSHTALYIATVFYFLYYLAILHVVRIVCRCSYEGNFRTPVFNGVMLMLCRGQIGEFLVQLSFFGWLLRGWRSKAFDGGLTEE